MEQCRPLSPSTYSISSVSQGCPDLALTILMSFCVMPSWRQTSISETVVPLRYLRRAHAWQSFLDGFVIPQGLFAQWCRGSGTENKPQGSCANRDAPPCVLASSSSLGRGHVMAWAGAVSHLCDLGHCFEPPPSMWLRHMTNTLDESCMIQLSRAANDGRGTTWELLCVKRLQKWELRQYIFFMKLLRQAGGQVF